MRHSTDFYVCACPTDAFQQLSLSSTWFFWSYSHPIANSNYFFWPHRLLHRSIAILPSSFSLLAASCSSRYFFSSRSFLYFFWCWSWRFSSTSLSNCCCFLLEARLRCIGRGESRGISTCATAFLASSCNSCSVASSYWSFFLDLGSCWPW
jgi:hypothetical protein